LVVQEYEQEELADDSQNEKRIKKAQLTAYRKKRQMASSAKKRCLDTTSPTATVTRSNNDQQPFEVM